MWHDIFVAYFTNLEAYVLLNIYRQGITLCAKWIIRDFEGNEA